MHPTLSPALPAARELGIPHPAPLTAFPPTVPASGDPGHPRTVPPAQALAWMMEGHARFASGRPHPYNHRARVEATADGQHPFAAILSCIDSRVPVETIFDLGIGDVFNTRVAGNVANAGVLASLEYACAVAGVRLVMVLGHTGCGAVQSAVKDVALGHVTGLLADIRPCLHTTTFEGERTAANPTFLDTVAEANVRLAVTHLTDRSSLLRDLVARDELQIVGALYRVDTGAVSLLD